MFVFLKKQCFSSQVAKLILNLLLSMVVISVSLSFVPSARHISQPSVVSVFPFSATSCTNSWSVSLLWPSFPYSFHTHAISSVAWKLFHFASVSLVPLCQSKTLEMKTLFSNFKANESIKFIYKPMWIGTKVNNYYFKTQSKIFCCFSVLTIPRNKYTRIFKSFGF